MCVTYAVVTTALPVLYTGDLGGTHCRLIMGAGCSKGGGGGGGERSAKETTSFFPLPIPALVRSVEVVGEKGMNERKKRKERFPQLHAGRG